MVVAGRVGRLWQSVRRWRTGSDDEALPVSPDLPNNDLRRVRRLVDEIIDARGGEVAARRRAQSLGLTYASLSERGQERFFGTLADEYGNDTAMVNDAIDHVLHARDQRARQEAEAELRAALAPRRETLLRHFVGLEGGLPFLIQMREDVRELRSGQQGDGDRLGILDAELRTMLERWFDVALLSLEQITWSTPAVFLEKLIEYEAVHAIGSWADLKARLGPGRRCYGYLHPAMPDDPIIFVEVALTEGMADAVGPLIHLDEGEPRTNVDKHSVAVEEQRYDTAIFYSISNCHLGLVGVSLGDFLIKSVVEELVRELPGLKRFATLSPLPGFRQWLLAELRSERPVLADSEVAALEADGFTPAYERVTDLVAGPKPPIGDALLAAAQPVLTRLAADYIVNQRRSSGRARDPVAHFHLSNGARPERLNWLANPSDIGWERGLGLMINYRYELKSIEANRDRYVAEGTVNASDSLTKLLSQAGD